MQSTRERLRQLHEEYFSIYETCLDHYLREALTIPENDFPEYIDRAASTPGLYYSVEGLSVNGFEYRVAQLTREVSAFWRTNHINARNLIRDLPGWHLQFPHAEYGADASRAAKRAAIYFDTLVLVDGFLS